MPFESLRRPAPDVRLQDVDDGEVALAACWCDRPIVLVFLRHFG